MSDPSSSSAAVVVPASGAASTTSSTGVGAAGGRGEVVSSSGNRTRLAGSGVVATRQLGIVARFTKSIKKYLLQPFVVGFAVALGMSFGYAAYDSITHRVGTFWKELM